MGLTCALLYICLSDTPTVYPGREIAQALYTFLMRASLDEWRGIKSGGHVHTLAHISNPETTHCYARDFQQRSIKSTCAHTFGRI
jgi:hypothetical protein